MADSRIIVYDDASTDFSHLPGQMPSPVRTENPESICIIRLSAIGDCCHTLPVVRTLQAAYPDTPITWVIGKTEYSLMEGADGIEFITFDKSQGFKGILDVRRKRPQKATFPQRSATSNSPRTFHET